jgi:ribosome biogenesis protein NSA1
MRILTGDECGILKECLPRNKKDNIRSLPTTASRRKGVVSLTWANEKDATVDSQFASLHFDSSVTLWGRSDETERTFASYHSVREICNVFTEASTTDTVTRPLGLSLIADGRLLACNTNGQVAIIKPLAPQPVHTKFSTISIPVSVNSKEVQYPLLTAMAVTDAHIKALALGGKERETILYDVETTKQIFKTKNLPPHPQTLLAPLVWPTCIEFLGKEGNRLAVGTAHNQVRLYDTRVARRPVAYTPDGLLDYRVTALCHATAGLAENENNSEHDLYLGDAAGTILKLDLRAIGRGTCKVNPIRYVGPAGSIRGLSIRGTTLAATGLDRMLRVYNTATAKEMNCLYMKQRINCLLLGNEDWKNEEDGNDDDGDIDQEDVVRDYVDSDDDGPRENEEANGVSEEEEDDDDSSSTDGDSQEEAEDQLGKSSNEDDSEDDDESEPKAPELPSNSRKRQKR